jgi:hypothetical protein
MIADNISRPRTGSFVSGPGLPLEFGCFLLCSPPPMLRVRRCLAAQVFEFGPGRCAELAEPVIAAFTGLLQSLTNVAQQSHGLAGHRS